MASVFLARKAKGQTMSILNPPLAFSIDLRWDSAIDRLEQKYGLRLDSWRRLGPNQRGKPCGRGWVGLRGACKRGKKSDDNAEKIKASKVELADKIRAKKGLRDRNVPKPVVEAPVRTKITKEDVNSTPWKYTAQQYQSAHGVHEPWIAEIAPDRMAEMSDRGKKKYFEGRSKEWDDSAAIKREWGDKVWSAYKSGKIKDSDLGQEKGGGFFGPLSAAKLVESRKLSEKKAGFEKALLEARSINTINELSGVEIGDRVSDLIGRGYSEVTKKYKRKVVTVNSEGKEQTIPTGRLQWKSYNDLVSAVKNGEQIIPTRKAKQ